MRFYGVRVSDVATLRRDRIKNDHIYFHALRGAPVGHSEDFLIAARRIGTTR